MNATSQSELFRNLPSTDELLRNATVVRLIEASGRESVVAAARESLNELRLRISSGSLNSAELEGALAALPADIEGRVERLLAYSLRAVINATGVVLHTNLGRAPLSAEAVRHAGEVASGYSNLEFDLEAGERGKRDVHANGVFEQLFARQLKRQLSTIVVNNNAAAVLIALNTLAEGGEVIVSRGELVEIGGSFRIPDVMAKSQAVLREVGTTNRTRISDFENAITDKTRLLLRVHRSNFEITGFTEQPSLGELVALGHKRSVPVMEDLGSGALMDLRSVGIGGEPTLYESLRTGVDVVTYSGDKMFGGPQAGLLTGNPDPIARIRKNQLFRALRVDKIYYAALEATMQAYLRDDLGSIPVLRMMRISVEEIQARSETVIAGVSGIDANLINGHSVIGGGAAPGSTLPTKLIALGKKGWSAERFAQALRKNTPPIVARVEDGRVLLDLRTVFPEQDATIVDALNRISG